LSETDLTSQEPSSLDGVRLTWRAALWVIEALPPARGTGANGSSPLRRRKLANTIRTLVGDGAEVTHALRQEVVPGVPFVLGLMWWATRQGVDDEVLHNWSTLQIAAGGALMRAQGSPRGAYAALAAFARGNAGERDTAFSERDIRIQTVSMLLAGSYD
jgi:hypothetical protein